MRQHAGGVLVAAVIVAAALAEGLFSRTGYAAAAILVWAAVIAGLVSRYLPQLPLGRLPATAALCLAGVVLVSFMSMAWASDQGRAFDEAVRATLFLGVFVLGICTAARLARDEWIAGLTIGLGAVSLYAVVAYLEPGLFGVHVGAVPGAVNRLSYPVGYWNATGSMMAVTAVLLADASTRGPVRWFRAASAAVIPVVLLGIWLTGSRAALGATLISWVVLLALAHDRPRRVATLLVATIGALVLIGAAEATGIASESDRASDGHLMLLLVVAVAGVSCFVHLASEATLRRVRVPRRATIVIVAAAGVITLGAIAAANPVHQFNDFKAPPPVVKTVDQATAGTSSHGRWQWWGSSFRAFKSSPADGLGAGGFEDYWARNATVPLYVRNPHSLPVQEFAELGLIGTLPFIGFLVALGVAIRRLVRSGRPADTGVLVAVVLAGALSSAVDWTWQFPAAFVPTVACAGLLVGSAPSSRMGRGGYWLGILGVVGGWLALIASSLVVLGELELSASRGAAEAGRTGAAAARAQAAHEVEPWSSEPYVQLALVAEQDGDLDLALGYIHKAWARDTQDWRLAAIEGRLQLERKDYPAANAALKRIRVLNKYVVFYGTNAVRTAPGGSKLRKHIPPSSR